MGIDDLVKKGREVHVSINRSHLRAVLNGKKPFNDVLAEKFSEVGVKLGL